MLIDRADVQAICEISDNDDLIDKLIPLAESRFFSLTKNNFVESKWRVSSNNVVINSSAKTVTVSGINLKSHGFTSNRHLVITGSMFNDGIFDVDDVTGGVITLASGSDLEDESSGELITLTRARIPDDVGFIVAQMIGWTIGNKALRGKQSVRLGDYQETLASAQVANFPDVIREGIENYKILRFE